MRAVKDLAIAAPGGHSLRTLLGEGSPPGGDGEVGAKQAITASVGTLIRMARGDGDWKISLLSEFRYQARSWPRGRRVVCKAEALAKGMNTRFVATNRPEPPANLYDGRYVMRGETENRIKDYKNAPRADRLICCKFLANQFRLFLHAAAYWLLDILRGRLASKGFGRMQLDTLRLRLVKIGGRVQGVGWQSAPAPRLRTSRTKVVAGSLHNGETRP